MASIKAKGTRPELAVRRALHAAGLRYRLHRRDLPGCPDLVFSSRRLVVFVHGCFWHQHPDSGCPIRKPAGGDNQGYWVPKLARNVARDERNRVELEARGWKVLLIWECESRDPDILQNIGERIAALPRSFRC